MTMLQTLLAISAALAFFNIVKNTAVMIDTGRNTSVNIFFGVVWVTLDVLAAIKLGTLAFTMGVFATLCYGLATLCYLAVSKGIRAIPNCALMVLYIVALTM